MNNYEKFKNMNIYEIVEILDGFKFKCKCCADCKTCTDNEDYNCKQGIEKWLLKECE